MSTLSAADTALHWVAIGLCLTTALIGTEWILLIGRGEVGTGGLFDWRVLRLRRSVLRLRLLSPLDRLFLSTRSTLGFVVAGMTASVCVVAFWGGPGAAVGAGALVGYQVALALRFPLGRDGADQLALVLSIAVLGYCIRPTPLTATVFAALICVHLVLGYEISGISKLAGRDWRTGRALDGILRTHCYGWPWLASVTPSWMSTAGGWAVMVFEAGFVAVLLPWPVVGLAVLGLGVVFHFACWVTMGLNAFFFTYVGAYPALAWLVLSR